VNTAALRNRTIGMLQLG